MSSRSITVGILMGSSSDLDAMRAVEQVLADLEIPHELRIMFGLTARQTWWMSMSLPRPIAGIQILICAAGMAAHLAGAVAGRTQLPVIGVPLGASMMGMDALLAWTVQMPPACRSLPLRLVGLARRMRPGWRLVFWHCPTLTFVNDCTQPLTAWLKK